MNSAGDQGSSERFTIRRAEMRDVRSIRLIDRDVFPTPWTGGATIAQVTAPGRVHFVVECERKLVGHGGLVFLADQAHVATIAVSESFWGQGVGDLLMKHLRVAAAKNESTTLSLEVRESNAPAIAFYERHGLTAVGKRKKYYRDNGEDALIMSAATQLS